MYTIEPCLTAIENMKNRLDKYPNVTIWQGVIGKDNWERDFYMTDEPVNHMTKKSKGNTLFRNYKEELSGKDEVVKTRVDALTLDSFCALNGISKIDILKINCEGGEYEIFECEEKDWLGITQNIILQVHLHSAFEPLELERVEMKETLIRSGFRLIPSKKGFESKGNSTQFWTKS